MKIVINKCFGGFGLSTAAMKRLISENAKGVQVHTEHEYTGGRGRGVIGSEKFVDAGDGYEVGRIPDVLYKDGKVYGYADGVRDCPILVKVVEEMGELADGECAKLSVVEIPDGIEYEIEEYDGNEHVAESHRTWG